MTADVFPKTGVLGSDAFSIGEKCGVVAPLIEVDVPLAAVGFHRSCQSFGIKNVAVHLLPLLRNGRERGAGVGGNDGRIAADRLCATGFQPHSITFHGDHVVSRYPSSDDAPEGSDSGRLSEGGVATPELGTRHLIHAHDGTRLYNGAQA